MGATRGGVLEKCPQGVWRWKRFINGKSGGGGCPWGGIRGGSLEVGKVLAKKKNRGRTEEARALGSKKWVRYCEIRGGVTTTGREGEVEREEAAQTCGNSKKRP